MSKDEQRKIEIIMNGQKANASLKEMKSSAKLLWNQMAKLEPTSKKFIAKSKEFQKVSARIKGVTASARGVSKSMTMLTGVVGQMFGAFGAYAVLAKVGQAWDYVTGKTKAFEKSLDTLQSITGATNADMAFYSEEAKQMGKNSTLSASQVADAFTLIGSKKPELLKNKEALAAVTKETITLAEAAGIDLVPAAEAMTQVLNQWEAPASDASRVINVLAAGSKYGAGNIDFLSDSMTRFGPTANAMGVSIEQSAAVMETFAEKGLESEKAGTQFRNILVELAKGADETNPEIVGLDVAIENLGKQNLTTAQLAQMFGKQNLIGAQILSTSSERVKEFTKALTGTSVAYEQQRINNDNWAGDLKSLDSVQETLALNLGEKMLPAQRAATQGWTGMLSKVSDWLATPVSEKLEKEQTSMNALVTSIASANEGSDLRNRLVIRLQEQYPDFIGNLDAETATNEQLRDRLKEVNAEYEKKILMARKEEEMNELMDERIDKQEKIAELTLEIAENDELAAEAREKDANMLGRLWNKAKANNLDAYSATLKNAIGANEEALTDLDVKSSELDEKWDLIAKQMGVNLNKVAEEVKSTNKEIIDSTKTVADSDEKLTKKKLEAERSFQDLRIAVIEDSQERERETAITKFNRDIEDLDRDSETYRQEVILLEEGKRQALEDLRIQYEEEDAAREEENTQLKLEEMELEEERRLLEVENAFLNAVTTEQELQEGVYQIQLDYAKKRLALAIASYGKDSVEALRAKNELLAMEKSHSADQISEAEALKNAKRAILDEGLAHSISIFESGAMLFRKGTALQKVAMKAYKAFAIGKIAIDTQREVRSIWTNYQANPKNILFPGWGAFIARLKQVAAVGRGAVSIQRIKSQQFADGGSTLPMVNIGGVWQAAKQIGSFAGGGNFSGNNVGVIGERGAEWVAPNWMLKHPATANIIGMLEAKRQQGQAFESGGSTAAQAAPFSSPEGGNGDMEEMLARIDARLAAQNEILMSWPANLKVYNSLTELEDGLKVLQKIRDDASVG